MDKSIQPNWQRLNDRTDRIFTEMEKYPEDVLQKQPDAHTWSASQNVVHLIKAERASLQYMKKKIAHTDENETHKAGIRSSFRFAALKMAVALPFLKFKAPTYIEPLEVKDLKSLKREWADLRMAYQDFLENLSPQWLNSELWKHQVAGKMSVSQMLSFFTDHVDRHARQIKRTLSK